MTDEMVLVVAAADLERLGPIAGFTADVGRYLPRLLDPAGLSFRPRAEVETDPRWLQLIPYVVLAHGGRLFCYTRGAAGGERRLHAKRSVGVGGHVNPVDSAAGDPYRAGLARELAEDVRIDSPYAEHVLGLVHDPSNPVGQVHLGVVHLFDLERPAVRAVDPALADGSFVEFTSLLAARDTFESWSRFVLDELERIGSG
jgi:predicted NUDIX family phosphoesterase